MAQGGRSGIVGIFDALARPLGGRLFVAILIVAAMFTLFLFALRAEKIFALPEAGAAAAEDLVAFWRAGVLALEGRAADAYDPALFRAGLSPKVAGLLFLNPPHFFLLVAPLGLLSYGAAKAAFLVASLLALIGLALVAARPLSRAPTAVFLILSPAVFASALVLQLGPFVALGLAAALFLSKDRPIIAGVLLALLTMKPQFGLLVPIFLAARGEWRAVIAAICATLIVVALSFAAFGPAPWQAFLDTARETYAVHASLPHREMMTMSQAAGKLGAPEAVRSIVQFGALLAGGCMTFIAARRWERETALGFTLLASAFVSPSLWVYDWPLVAAGLIVLARRTAPWPLLVQAMAGLVWIAPLISLGVGTRESSVFAPLLLAGAVFAFWLAQPAALRQLRGRQGSFGGSGSSGGAGGSSAGGSGS